MKQKLLLICVCLFAAVSGVKAWTSVDPENGGIYYLYNVGYEQFWYGTNTNIGGNQTRYFGITDDYTKMIPVKVSVNNGTYTFTYYVGNNEYQMRHQTDGGESYYEGGSADFTMEGSKDDGFHIKYSYTKSLISHTRRLRAEGSNSTCDFPENQTGNSTKWKFVLTTDVCASVAEENYVSGWEKVTSVSALKTTPENYFFAIFSANVPGLILDATTSNSETPDDKTKPYYKTAANPLSSSQYLFEMKTCGSGLALKSCSIDRYFANSSGNPWHYNATKSSVDDDCEISVTLSDGVYSIQAKHAEGVNNYLGLWWPENGYKTGQKLAGNKSIAEKGLFLIYRIAKKDLDMTSAIVNPSFETGNTDGWTFSTTGANDAAARSNGDGTYTMSGVDGSWLFNIWAQGNPISQTLANMPAGIYKLTAVMGTDKDQEFRLTMGGVTGTNTSSSEGKGTGVTVEAYYKLTTPGSITISADAGGSCWYKVDNFRLTYMEPSLPESLEELTDLMNITKKNTANAAISAYNTAIATYNSDQTSANLAAALAAYDAAQNAITAAEASADIYASVTSSDIAAYKSRMGELLATTNVYTTEAYEKWYANVEDNYTNGVYTDEEVVTLTEDNAYPITGSSYDGAYYKKANHIDDVLLSTWTIGEDRCSDYSKNLYINVWSVEGNNDGSEFRAPFFEYWTGDANSLNPATMESTMTGLDASTEYSLDIWARVRQTNGQTKVNNKITLQLSNGDAIGDAIDISAGEQVGTSQFYLKHFRAYGKTDASGNLTITITVANDSKVSWLAFKDLMLKPKAEVTVSAKAGKYGTVIFPFTPDVSTGFDDIKFYSCASVNNGYTQIVEVLTPEANTPYIIKNNGGSNFSKTISGFSVAEEDSYTDGLLTGVYTNAYIPVSDASNSYYVLQTKDDVQAFYKVEDADFPGTPYKCYLTIPAATPVKAFLFPENPTAINAIEAAENENTEIYNLAGQRLSKLQKGVNIINGKKVLVK